MAFLSGLIRGLRNDADQVGSFFTGQPAHTPTPPPTPIRQVQQPPLQVRPVQTPQFSIQTPKLPTIAAQQQTQNVYKPTPLPVQTAHPLPIANAPMVHPAGLSGRPDNTLQINSLLHPSLGQQVKTGLEQKLQVPGIVGAQAHELGQQTISRPLVQLGTSLTGKQHTFTPDNPIEKTLFGSQPVQNIEKGVASTYQNHKNLPAPFKIGLAGAYGAGQVAQDLPVVGGLFKEGGKALEAIEPHLANTAASIASHTKNLAPLDQNGFINLSRGVNRHPAVQALNDKLDELNQKRGQLLNQGLSESSSAVRANAKAYKSALVQKDRTIKQILQGGYAKIPGGEEPKPHVFVPKGRLEADPELQSLYDTAAKAQSLSPMERLHAEEAVTGHMSRRNLQAEQNAVLHLRNGGSRDEAIKIYAKTAGVSPKMAKFQVGRAAKQADQALNVSKAVPNKLLNDFELPRAKAGEFERVSSNHRAVTNSIGLAEKRALSYEHKLAPEDRAAFDDYVQGVRDVRTAKNPALVQEAVDEWQKAADTVHALGQNFGNTKHIENFFPGYWEHGEPTELDIHKAEQAMEEEYGTQYWNSLSADEKAQLLAEHQADQAGAPVMNMEANYGGFHNKGKVFKTNAEGRAAGYTPLSDNPFDAMRRYFGGAKLQLGNQAIIQGVRDAEPIVPKQQYSIDLPGNAVARVGKQGYKLLKQNGVKPPANIVIRGLKGVNRTIVKTIVANPLIHGGNQEFNSLFSAAWNMPGVKIANMAKIVANQARFVANHAEYEKWRTDFYKGGFSPDYGKDQYGFIAKGLEKIGLDPKHAELSPRAMASIEENIRVSLYRTGRLQGLSHDAALKTVDQALGDSKLLGDMSSGFGLFLHYLTTNTKILGRAGISLVKGNPKPLLGLAAGYAAWMAANKAWQEVTGNPNASVRAPGVLGTASQLAKAPGQLGRGQVPSVITSHTNPLIRLGVEQATNRDLSKPVAGPEGANNKLSGPGGSGRTSQILKDTLGPAQSTMKVASGKSSPAEQAAGALLGLYTPHATGSQASPKIKLLNTPNAQSGNGLDAQNAYFAAKDNAIRSLGNSQKDVDTFNAILEKEHDPNTGQSISTSPRDRIAIARTLYANDAVRNAVQQFEKSQPKHDPKWDLSPQQLKVFEDYQGMFTGDADRIGLEFNNPWLAPFLKQRAQSFDNSETANSKNINNPENVAYPNIDNGTQSKLDQITALTSVNRRLTPDEKAQLQQLEADPSVQKAYKSFDTYTNSMRKAEGAPAYKPTPEADQATQDFMTEYNAADKATRKALRNSYPTAYANMIGYYDQLDLHTIDKQVANTEFVGQPDFTGKELKAISGVAPDIVTNSSNGQYGLIPAAWMSNAVKSGQSGSSSGSHSYSKHKKTPKFYMRRAKRIKVHHVSRQKKIGLSKPPSPIKIKNKANTHVGIKSTTYL